MRIILVHAVDEGIATEGIARIKRGPEPVGEGIANVSFESGEQLLPEDFRSLIRGVVSVKGGVGVGIDLPFLLRAEGVRDSKLRVERPAI